MKNARSDIIKLLIAYGSDVNAPTEVGNTSLHEACKLGNSKTVLVLAESGANVDSQGTSIYKLHQYELYLRWDIICKLHL